MKLKETGKKKTHERVFVLIGFCVRAWWCIKKLHRHRRIVSEFLGFFPAKKQENICFDRDSMQRNRFLWLNFIAAEVIRWRQCFDVCSIVDKRNCKAKIMKFIRHFLDHKILVRFESFFVFFVEVFSVLIAAVCWHDQYADKFHFPFSAFRFCLCDKCSIWIIHSIFSPFVPSFGRSLLHEDDIISNRKKKCHRHVATAQWQTKLSHSTKIRTKWKTKRHKTEKT